MKIINKLKNNISLLWFSFFKGMESANNVMISQKTSSNSNEIVNHINGGGFFSDMLQQQETNEVVEIRDKYYRIIKEADKWDVSHLTLTEDANGELTFGNINSVKKKHKEDFIKHPPVYNPENYYLRVIQDNKQTIKESMFVAPTTITGLTDYDTTIIIERDKIIPRFMLEKYATRVIVRHNEDKAYVDLYLPAYPSQFGKIDAILIANLKNIYDTKNFRGDLLDFTTIKWYSDKAWNSDDVCLFEYKKINTKDINIFDGSYVITFECEIIHNGKDLTEKYKTEELDEKYKNNDIKGDSLNFLSAARQLQKNKDEKEVEKIDVNNLNNTTLKLT